MTGRIFSEKNIPLSKFKTIGADIPLNAGKSPIKGLLASFRELTRKRSDVRLVLTGKRSAADSFSVWGYLDENGLVDKVDFLPYYETCSDFPLQKLDCDVWIERDTPPGELTAAALQQRLEMKRAGERRTALFFTSFHPAKYEGNSRLMRQWLECLRAGGYAIHLVYYMLDADQTTRAMRREARHLYDVYEEVPVSSRLVGTHPDNLNVHVDDWCGFEAIQAVRALTERFSYDLAIVNYPFMSAVFDAVAPYTRKVLLTHDSFTDRNRRMAAQGYGGTGWVSLDERGERLACQRADIVVALQGDEAAHFRKLCGDSDKVRVVSPLMDELPRHAPPAAPKLRIGYFGSSNWVNEQNLASYMTAWLSDPLLSAQSEIIIAGDVGKNLSSRATNGEKIMAGVRPRLLGRVDNLQDFFDACDIIINPERGGTGIKIKTLEAMAAGMPVLSTAAGTVGIGTTSRFHTADDAAALARLTAELVRDRALITEAGRETAEAYRAYRDRDQAEMSRVLGIDQDHLESAHVLKNQFSARPDADTQSRDETGPLVSVIVPFYKVEAYFDECLASIVGQRYRNLDIILVDDVSPDNSLDIAERYARQDSRIRIVRHAINGGLGEARNTGVRHARGAFITFLDSDDLFASPDAIATLVAAAERTGCPVVIGASQKLFDGKRLEPNDLQADRDKLNKDGAPIDGLDAFRSAAGLPCDYYAPLRAWGTLIDRAFYDELGLDYPVGEHEDMGHTPFLYFKAGRVVYLQDIVVTYRMRPGSISHSAWTGAALVRYGNLWRNFKAGMQRFGLAAFTADVTVTFAIHMLWRMRTNGFDDDAHEVAVSLLEEMMSDARQASDIDNLHTLLTDIRAFLAGLPDGAGLYQRLVRAVSPGTWIRYYSLYAGKPPSAQPEEATAAMVAAE